MNHRTLAVATAVVTASLLGCASDERSSGVSSSSQGPAASAREAYDAAPADPSLPDTLEELTPFFTSDLESMGVRLTRAAIIQLDAGPHLQLYVQPETQSSSQGYLDRLVPLARLVGPSSFARWSSLATFDICQEPFGAESSPSTPPVSVVFLTREQVDMVEWSDATIADLRDVVEAKPGGEVTVSAEIEALPEWQAATPS